MRNPKEIAINFENAAKNKATLPLRQMVALAVFAGMYIALAGSGPRSGLAPLPILRLPNWYQAASSRPD